MTARRITLDEVRAELEAQWLSAVVRQMNLRWRVRLCDREIAALERRLEMIGGAGGERPAAGLSQIGRGAP